MRIATFNVENLFCRPKAMNQPKWTDGQPAINAAGELNALFNKETYSDSDKSRMLTLLKQWGLLATRPNNKWLEFRLIRDHLFKKRPNSTAYDIVANGRGDWIGWIELKEESIADEAIENTARVIAEVDPDVLTLVEVEDRIALDRFVKRSVNPMLEAMGKKPFVENMVIDGNDERGIDVGILSKFPIVRMRSHIAQRSANGGPLFSRDCPEYYLKLGGGKELVMIPNHFASKGSDKTGARRRVQATAARSIYEAVRKTHEFVVVSGDLNDHPQGGSLDDLLNSELVDAMATPKYTGAHPGTYKTATADNKIDYLLLSPAMQKALKHVDVERRGFYAPTKWKSFPNLTSKTKERFQASDHHCVYADVNV